jgi:hypothetical protein
LNDGDETIIGGGHIVHWAIGHQRHRPFSRHPSMLHKADRLGFGARHKVVPFQGAPITATVNSNSQHSFFSSIFVSNQITACNHSHPFVPAGHWNRRKSYYSLVDHPIRSTVQILSHQPPRRVASTNRCTPCLRVGIPDLLRHIVLCSQWTMGGRIHEERTR